MEGTRTVRTLTSADVEVLVAQAGPLRRLPRSRGVGTPPITLPPSGRRWPRAVGVGRDGHLRVGSCAVGDLPRPSATVGSPILVLDEVDESPPAAALVLTLPPALLAELPVELPRPGDGDWYRDGHLLLVALTEVQLCELDAAVPLRRTRRTTAARTGRSRPRPATSSGAAGVTG